MVYFGFVVLHLTTHGVETFQCSVIPILRSKDGLGEEPDVRTKGTVHAEVAGTKYFHGGQNESVRSDSFIVESLCFDDFASVEQIQNLGHFVAFGKTPSTVATVAALFSVANKGLQPSIENFLARKSCTGRETHLLNQKISNFFCFALVAGFFVVQEIMTAPNCSKRTDLVHEALLVLVGGRVETEVILRRNK